MNSSGVQPPQPRRPKSLRVYEWWNSVGLESRARETMAEAETRLQEVRWCEGRLNALVDADQLNEADYMRIANVLQAYHKVLSHQLKRKREDPDEDENWANVRHAMDLFRQTLRDAEETRATAEAALADLNAVAQESLGAEGDDATV